MDTGKFCKDCKTIKPISEYYKAGNSTQSRCKQCHNKYGCYISHLKVLNKVKKNPFQKKSQDFQDEFIKYYGTMPLKKLCEKMNINYNTCIKWKIRGFLDF